MLDSIMDASKLPHTQHDPVQLDLAARYAPIILADEREPFTIVACGYTIFDREDASLSFPKRRIAWTEEGYPAVRAIEYAL